MGAKISVCDTNGIAIGAGNGRYCELLEILYTIWVKMPDIPEEAETNPQVLSAGGSSRRERMLLNKSGAWMGAGVQRSAATRAFVVCATPRAYTVGYASIVAKAQCIKYADRIVVL